MSAAQKVLFYQVAVVLALLAAAGVLATVSNVLTGVQVYAIVSVIAGGAAVAGGIALSSTSNLIPHLILILAVIGLTVAMALEHVFGTVEVTGVFGYILGGGAIGAAITNTQMSMRSGRHASNEH